MLSAGVQTRLIKRDHKVGQPQTFEVRGPVTHQQRIAAIGKAHKQGAVVPLRLQHLHQKHEDVKWRSEAPGIQYCTLAKQALVRVCKGTTLRLPLQPLGFHV